MNFEQLRKLQNEAYRILQNSFYLEKLSHAYLFEGFLGCGTEEMALYMAMQLLCSSDSKPCLECDSCQKVLANNHMNVIIIEPDGQVIKKEQIEDLIHEFSMSSIEGGNQVYIIKQAEKMNTSAANTLLKFLEEPVHNRYGFLVTANKNIMLPTIISRTQVIHFKSISNDLLLNQLKDNGVNEDIAYASISLTNNIDDIMEMISEGKLNKYVEIASSCMKALLNNEDPFITYYLNRDVFQEEKETKWHHFFFDVIALIYQEMISINLHNEQKYFKDIITLDNVLKQKKIDRDLNLISEYEERLNYYVNISLLYTSFFCELVKEDKDDRKYE